MYRNDGGFVLIALLIYGAIVLGFFAFIAWLLVNFIIPALGAAF